MAESKSSAEARIATAVYEAQRVVETNNLEDLGEAALMPAAIAAELLLTVLEGLAERLS